MSLQSGDKVRFIGKSLIDWGIIPDTVEEMQILSGVMTVESVFSAPLTNDDHHQGVFIAGLPFTFSSRTLRKEGA